jgi:hypothetical protein
MLIKKLWVQSVSTAEIVGARRARTYLEIKLKYVSLYGVVARANNCRR